MAQKINLLIVNPMLYIGGAEVVIQNLCYHLNKDMFNISVCCLKEIGTIGEELMEDGYDVHCLPATERNRVDYFTAKKLLRVIREKKIQIIHSHATHALVDSCLSRLLSTFSSTRPAVVHTFHCGEYPIPQKKRDLLERIFWRFTNQLVAVGNMQKKQIQTTYTIPDEKIVTIWNGVSPAKTSSETLDFTFPENTTGTVIGTIGTLFEQKGITYLLDTAVELKKRGYNCTFLVAGEGPLRSKLDEKRRALGLEDTVQFLGWVPNASLHLLPRIDIFFQPSLWEAMSIVVLEAMMNAKPIVATRVGENENVINHGVNGFLTEIKSVGQMVKYLEQYLTDTSLQKRMGSAAKEEYDQRFTAEVMARRYEKLYVETLLSTSHKNN